MARYFEMDLSHFTDAEIKELKEKFNVRDVYFFEMLGTREHHVAIKLEEGEVAKLDEYLDGDHKLPAFFREVAASKIVSEYKTGAPTFKQYFE